MSNWSLTELYPDYGTEFTSDLKQAQQLIGEITTFTTELVNKTDYVTLETYLKQKNDFITLISKLYSFISLNIATNTSDPVSNNYAGLLAKLISQLAKPETLAAKWIAEQQALLPTWFKESSYLKEHEFHLHEIITNQKYLLHEDTENIISLMEINASTAWSNLQDLLTSKAEVKFNNETLTLAQLRNQAYSADPVIRKQAYETELALYDSLQDAIAFALNSIKGEVVEISKARGYQSVIEKTLIDSRLSEASLKAMFSAIDEALPAFRKYLKHKAALLGHEAGLPFYDLFAPMGDASSKEYSIQDAKEFIFNCFSSFSPDLANLAERAFNENWIDFYPKKGKVGGAFCANLQPIKQSRILANYGGTLNDVRTLAHELGHAYHGYRIEELQPINADYTMPVAETASIFSENIVFDAALKQASVAEKIQLIENSLQDITQTVVDIYSRYLFESEVIERRANEFLFADDLKQIMLKAQQATYGDGLAADYLHPYMWVCKGHYYSVHRNFYNFPYAFGGLFALGLYAQYQKQGPAFVASYDALLTATTTNSCEAVAALANVDISKPDFWRASLKIVEKRIEQLIELTPLD